MTKHELVAEMAVVQKKCLDLFDSAKKLAEGDDEQKKLALEISEGVGKILAQQKSMLATLKEMD